MQSKRKKRRVKRIVTLVIVLLILGGFGFAGYKVYDMIKTHIEEEKNAWKIEIITESVNVRNDHNAIAPHYGKAYKGEVFKVVETYRDDKKFVWYKVKFRGDMEAWIASDRNNPYVKEINNKEIEEAEESSEHPFEYVKPDVKFFSEDYYVKDINSITTDHLDIYDDSDYTIKYEVYYEEKPLDRDEPQYWIQWVVTVEFGNTTKKVQRIIFEVEPQKGTVKDFKKMKR